MDYKKALENSPEWVKLAYAEYSKLDQKTMNNTPFLWFLLGDGKGTPPFKMPKKESVYKEVTPYPNAICGNCLYYYQQPLRKIGVCSWIRGNVGYNAWCKFWKGLPKN